MPRFWRAAARVLRPGGTVAIWGASLFHVRASFTRPPIASPPHTQQDPETTPNAAAVQSVLDSFEASVVTEFSAPGNLIARDLYRKLPLPFGSCPDSVFPHAQFTRIEWNADGLPTPRDKKASEGEPDYFAGHPALSLALAKKAISTASPITRWREAHKAQVERGDVRDCVDVLFEDMKRAMGPEYVGRSDEDVIVSAGLSMALLLIKRGNGELDEAT